MKFEINKKALQDLEKQLSATVKVPNGSEAAAIRSVKQEYKTKTGAELTDEAARNLVRRARNR
ncbi:hypothetical protein [Nocardia nova]|uniref:hypothetical protein n=1 Tax=Nocardia nova TaxID=37330 RepID=UPI0033C26D20